MRAGGKSNSLGSVVRRVSTELRRKGSPEFARSLQRFFKEPIQAHGWRTADVRRLAFQVRREIIAAGQGHQLLSLAERFFARPASEEWAFGVFLLQGWVRRFGDPEFWRLERWLHRLRNWGDCDAVSIYLLGPMIASDFRRVAHVFRWAKSKNRWARRAAAASLVPTARKGMYLREIFRLSDRPLGDPDDMVQKGLGWLLRETGKAKPKQTAAYLWAVRRRAPRLVLRAGCEKLPVPTRRRILA